jgi:uncharacterized protein (TIGR02452 family)
MNTMSNINIWNDTVSHIMQNHIGYDTKLYNFDSLTQNIQAREYINSLCAVVNSDCLNFDYLKRFITPKTKIALLNFANPIKPAMGIPKNNTQEEVILRRTTLPLFLYNIDSITTSTPTGNQFYPLKSGELLYSKDVKVIKDANNVLIKPYTIDIITGVALIAPAIYNDHGVLYYKRKADYEYMRNYIELIFQTAIKNNADILILGAFGCGAFQNPVHDTANIFNEMIRQYKQYFACIAFPIINDVRGNDNFSIFSQIINT